MKKPRKQKSGQEARGQARKQKRRRSQPLRKERTDMAFLMTSKCLHARLWFVNNDELSDRIHAFLAKYAQIYGVKVYAFILTGNHYHLVAQFTRLNRARFLRDLNSRIANSVKLLVDDFEGGPLFEKRPSIQALPTDNDVLKYFFYCALQPVSSGLCSKISEYPGYNFYNDAVRGIVRTYSYLEYGAYNEMKRRGQNPSIDEHTYKFALEFSRLPGHEKEARDEYIKFMTEEFLRRREEYLKEHNSKNEGHRYLVKSELRKVRAGSKPKNTKSGNRQPLVLTDCPVAKENFLAEYFSSCDDYEKASERYRSGDFQVPFPKGMFRPPGVCLYEGVH